MISWGDGRKSTVGTAPVRVFWTDGSSHIFHVRYDLDREDPLTIAVDRVRAGGFTSRRTGDVVEFGIVRSVQIEGDLPMCTRGRMPG